MKKQQILGSVLPLLLVVFTIVEFAFALVWFHQLAAGLLVSLVILGIAYWMRQKWNPTPA